MTDDLNPHSFRRCLQCGGEGFQKAGAFPYSFAACSICKGSGQSYLKPAGVPAALEIPPEKVPEFQAAWDAAVAADAKAGRKYQPITIFEESNS